MNNKLVPFLILIVIHYLSYGQSQKKTFTLEHIINSARSQSPIAKQAETRKQNGYWSYKQYKSGFNPQLNLRGSLPGYANAFNDITQDDGTIRFQTVNQINSNINLGLEQPLLWTGGLISVNSNLFYFDAIGDNVSNQLWSGSAFNIRLNQPIFGFNRLKWLKKTEPLRYEESKREFVEELESISREAVSRFFNYMDAQINLQIAQFNLTNNDTVYLIEQGRYNIGKTSKDKLLQVELQLLRSKQNVSKAKLGIETAKLRLKSYIGMTEDTNFDLIIPSSIPDFTLDYEEALTYGRQYRADYLAFKRRKLEAAREVARAKGGRFETDLVATFGLNNSGSELNNVYNEPLNEQRVNIGFQIPIITWGRNEARLQTAIANQELQNYVIAQEEQNFEQEILTQVKQFDLLRIQLEITKKSDEVAQERYDVAQNRYLIGKINITDLNIALTEKDQAKRAYIKALRDFWTSYYNIRKLTLYDFNEKRLLYSQD